MKRKVIDKNTESQSRLNLLMYQLIFLDKWVDKLSFTLHGRINKPSMQNILPRKVRAWSDRESARVIKSQKGTVDVFCLTNIFFYLHPLADFIRRKKKIIYQLCQLSWIFFLKKKNPSLILIYSSIFLKKKTEILQIFFLWSWLNTY